MDLLDVAIDAMLKGAVSHYVRKSLEKIDQGLGLIVKSGNREEIKEYVTQNQLIQPVTDLASQTLRESFVVPTMPESIATFEDRAELFQHVLQFGFNISHKLQVDLVLPGSLHSRDTLTVFMRNSENVPKLARVGNRVGLPKDTKYQNQVYFLPLPYDEVMQEFKSYKKKLIQHLEDSSGYFRYDITQSRNSWDMCRLEAITAGSCFFEYAAIMSGFVEDYYKPEGNRVAIKDWAAGLSEMFTAVSEVPNLRYLSDAETKKIKDAYELFQMLN